AVSAGRLLQRRDDRLRDGLSTARARRHGAVASLMRQRAPRLSSVGVGTNGVELPSTQECEAGPTEGIPVRTAEFGPLASAPIPYRDRGALLGVFELPPATLSWPSSPVQSIARGGF